MSEELDVARPFDQLKKKKKDACTISIQPSSHDGEKQPRKSVVNIT